MEIENGKCMNDLQEENGGVPESHLKTKSNVSIKMKSHQAFSLTGAHLPVFDGSNNSIHDIIEFLDVEKSARYKCLANATFCNIYAHDYASLMRAFVPRVWWTDQAIKDKNFKEKYGVTVRELNANSLYEWFDDYGIGFGWKKLESTTEAQEHANEGRCVIMVAANKNRKRSGHIVVVVPETDSKLAVGARGIIIYPLQSQAGARNKKYFAKKWWGGMEKLRIYSR